MEEAQIVLCCRAMSSRLMRPGRGSRSFADVVGVAGGVRFVEIGYRVVGWRVAVEAVGRFFLVDFALTVLGAGGAGALVGLIGNVVIESSSV